jgi:tetratricopeptide (TPR) repeat protein
VPVAIPSSVEDLFGAGRSWDQVLTANGPYDEPSLCLIQGYLFMQTGLYRQAAESFDRVREFSDSELSSRLWLAQLHLIARQPQEALALAQEIRAVPDRFPLDATNRLQLFSVEASALFAASNSPAAIALIKKELNTPPYDEQLVASAVALFNQQGLYTNSLAVLDHQLELKPGNLSTLLNRGAVLINLTRYDEAIATLNQLLKVETNNPSALFNRAIAYERSGRLAEAKVAYEGLQRQYPTTYQLYNYLGNIALLQGDTNAAIRLTESYLTNAPPEAPDYAAMAERLRSLKGIKPK